MKRLFCIIVQVLLSSGFAFGADAPQTRPVVEISQPLPPAHFLGTVSYASTERERPFLAKVTEKPLDLWAGNPMPPGIDVKEDPKAAAEEKKNQQEQLARAKAYTLANQAGEYVGWFGIVRKSSWNEAAQQTELLLQHCYYDGANDVDIQIVSIYGAGDFRANLHAKAENIPPLSLVRVYGKVLIGKDGSPEVTVDYARVWDWGLFTFMDYGIDKTNPKWRALRHVDGPDVYAPRPTPEFYEKLLGKREPPVKGDDAAGK
jgi:hypothetical protein